MKSAGFLASSGLHGLIGLARLPRCRPFPRLADPAELSGVKAERGDALRPMAGRSRLRRFDRRLEKRGLLILAARPSRCWRRKSTIPAILRARERLVQAMCKMRLRAINDVAQRQHPGTAWAVQLTPIGAIGGN